MASDEERRETAAKLRRLAKQHDGVVSDLVGKHLGLVPDDRYIARSVYTSDSVSHLADLIDRQTCRTVECVVDHGSRSWGMRCTACGKEFEHMKPGFGWRYCPGCGRAVVAMGKDIAPAN